MLKELRRIIEEVEAASNLGEAFTILVKRTREALETEACSVFVVDFRTHEYILMAAEGYQNDALYGVRIKPHQGLIGIIADQEKPLNLENAQEHPNYLMVPERPEDQFHAFLGVPIISNRRVLGVIIIEQKELRRFEEEEEAFLVTLATQVANVIARTETYDIIDEQTAQTHDDTVLLGVPSGPGVGIGETVVVYPAANLDAVISKATENIPEEINALKRAIEKTHDMIENLGKRLSPLLPEAEQELFAAYLRLLESDGLEQDIIEIIETGQSAQSALKDVVLKRMRQFDEMDDPYLRERAADIKDLGQRVLANLQTDETAEIEYPESTILIGEELSAADLARVPEGCLRGIASAKGSANSHVAILARALGIPAVSGVTNLPYAKLENKELIIDGYYGHVYVTPTKALRQEFLLLAEEERLLDESLEKLHDLPAETPDGKRVKLMVNAGLDADASLALAAGSEGVGLFRTEVPFMTRERFPSEEEQRVIYRQLLNAFAPRDVVMRTLDIGGDKTLPYFPIEEENPFLGWRGIRISLDQPDLFQAQIRAMLRANRGLNNLKILLPMISGVGEFEDAKALIEQAHQEVNEEEETVMPKLGVMIEVPSAVYQARGLARRADFLSVGSNDLTQYLLAVDRNNARVSGIYDAYHPALLHALHQTVRAARLEQKPVSICGELAGDPVVTILLLAMGFDTLSTSASNLPRIKWVIRRFPYAQARKILKEVMKCENPTDIRNYLEETLEQSGLGGLIRAGR
jgi:phosphotransferase system, enzyme I, PtsP